MFHKKPVLKTFVKFIRPYSRRSTPFSKMLPGLQQCKIALRCEYFRIIFQKLSAQLLLRKPLKRLCRSIRHRHTAISFCWIFWFQKCVETQVPITHGFVVRAPLAAVDQCFNHDVNVITRITTFQLQTVAHVFQVRVSNRGLLSHHGGCYNK